VTAREEMLARIRKANATAAGQAATREPSTAQPSTAQPTAGPLSTARQPAGPTYRTHGERDTAALMNLLAERLTDYRAIVRRTTIDRLAAEVAAALTERGARRVVVPAGLNLGGLDLSELGPANPGSLAAGVEVVVDDGLDAAALDACDGAVTGAAVAIAETGTIVLDGSPDQGRRAITLVPDYHLCIVRAEQVVELVPEAVARLSGSARAPLTWISGPSATSDIELERVEGVHGPRTLEVILVGDTASA
jgi:L-lactate dehydrogenase complex protein LldG